jgi:hypothetical protein
MYLRKFVELVPKFFSKCTLLCILSIINVVPLFSNDISREAQKLNDILDHFGILSISMELNIHKYFVSFNGLEEGLEKSLPDIFPFNSIDFKKGFKYLGYNLKLNGYQKKYWG